MEKQEIKLEKKLSAINVWALALGCIIGWGAFVMPGNIFLPKAGPLGTAIAMGIATIIMIIIAFNYDYMINKYPFAGGEFTYTKAAFGKEHAFTCSWFLSLSYLTIVPLNATALALISRNLMDNIFQVGFHYNVAGYDVYLGEILLAVFAVIFFAWLSIRGVVLVGVFQTILVGLLIVGILIILVAAVFSHKVSLNNFLPAFSPQNSEVLGVLAVLAVIPWAFVGFDTVPQATEEFKFSPKQTKLIMVFSIIFGASIYTILNVVTIAIIPNGYVTWVEYIHDLPNLRGISSMPTFNVANILLGTPGVIFLSFSVLAAILSGIIGFYMATSRLFYAMAKEGVIPSWFAKLNGKYKTPQNAIAFIMIISLFAPFFGRTVLGWIVDMSSIGAAIGYLYTSAAALKYAKEKGDIWIIITGFLGIMFAIFFIVLLLIPIPIFDCSLGKESFICLFIWIMLGVLFYRRSIKH